MRKFSIFKNTLLKRKLLLFLFFVLPFLAFSQQLYFPPLNGDAWETVSPLSLGWCEDKIDTLLNFLESQDTKAFIVLQDGKIAIEKYYGDFTQDSFWYWASAGKSMTAYLVGIAEQEGLLSLDDLSSDYLGIGWTDCPPDKESLITIRNQLSMTTGLDDGIADNHCTYDSCLIYLEDAGSRWAYHNAPYTLLDGVIENATGQTLNAYYYTKMRLKTGMNGFYIESGFDNVLVSNARSMARFGLLTLNQGAWGDIPVLNNPSYFDQMTNSSQQLNKSYGYLWWLNGKESYMLPTLQFVFNGFVVPSAPEDMIAAMGKNGQIINVVPSRNLVFIRMGEAPGDFSEVPNYFDEAIWQKLNQVFCSPNAVDQVESPEFTSGPNPFENEIFVDCGKQNAAIRFEIFNIRGQKMLQGFTSGKINASQLRSGIYLLRLISDDITQQFTLVKM